MVKNNKLGGHLMKNNFQYIDSKWELYNLDGNNILKPNNSCDLAGTDLGNCTQKNKCVTDKGNKFWCESNSDASKAAIIHPDSASGYLCNPQESSGTNPYAINVDNSDQSNTKYICSGADSDTKYSCTDDGCKPDSSGNLTASTCITNCKPKGYYCTDPINNICTFQSNVPTNNPGCAHQLDKANVPQKYDNKNDCLYNCVPAWNGKCDGHVYTWCKDFLPTIPRPNKNTKLQYLKAGQYCGCGDLFHEGGRYGSRDSGVGGNIMGCQESGGGAGWGTYFKCAPGSKPHDMLNFTWEGAGCVAE